MRPRFFGIAGSCRCDAKSPKRPSNTFGGPVTPAPARSAAVIPLCAAKPECRNFVCVPSTQHSRSPAAQLPAVPAAQASCSTPSLRIFRAHGNAERSEESGRMKAAAMELPGRHAADAAGDLVGDRDRQNQSRPRHRPRLGKRERGRDRGTAHVHDRFVVRVVVLEGLRQRGVGERGRRRAERVAGCRRSGPDRAATASAPRRSSTPERCLGAGECQADHVEDAELGGINDVRGEIVVLHLRHPRSDRLANGVTTVHRLHVCSRATNRGGAETRRPIRPSSSASPRLRSS